MKSKIVLILTFSLLSGIAIAQQAKKDTVKLFFLAGQSNMDGYGLSAELPKNLQKENKDVWIFHGNPTQDGDEKGGLGIWETLKPGHGAKFSSDGKTNMLSDRFGIEITFAKKLQELYPNEKIALVKYSKGGSAIDSVAARSFGCWEPDFVGTNGLNQYDFGLKTIRKALQTTDINGDGVEDVLIPCGIVWMQGESDAFLSEEVANRYYANLKRLMDLFRASLRVDDLPVVIGKISDSWNDKDGKVWEYGELVQYAQEKFAREDKAAAIVRTTRYYKYSDPWHYNSEGYIDLGEKFAEAMYGLTQE